MLDHIPPRHVKANSWHVNNVNVFLNDTQIVGDGVDSRFAMWTEANTDHGYARRYACSGRNEEVTIVGRVRIEWNADYKKKLAEEDAWLVIYSNVETIKKAFKEMGATSVSYGYGPLDPSGDTMDRVALLNYYKRLFPKYHYGHASIAAEAMLKLSKAALVVGKCVRINVDLPPLLSDIYRGRVNITGKVTAYLQDPALLESYRSAQEKLDEDMKRYIQRLAWETVIGWPGESIHGVYVDEAPWPRPFKTTDGWFTVSEEPKVEARVKPAPKENWDAADDEMVKDMLTANTGGTAWGYVRMPDGHMSFCHGLYRGAFDKNRVYKAFEVFREKGEFRMWVPDGNPNAPGLTHRRLNLSRLDSAGDEEITNDLKAACNTNLKLLAETENQAKEIGNLQRKLRVAESAIKDAADSHSKMTDVALERGGEIARLNNRIGDLLTTGRSLDRRYRERGEAIQRLRYTLSSIEDMRLPAFTMIRPISIEDVRNVNDLLDRIRARANTALDNPENKL